MSTFAPGAHFESTNVRNLLHAAGVELSEAMCLGIGGGIAAGYQFCPSVPSNGYGGARCSGSQFISRVKMMSTAGAWYRDTFTRLGVPFEARESGGVKAAQANLTEGLAAGLPVVAWTTPMQLAYTVNWTVTGGMYTVLVHAATTDTVAFSDHVSVREMGLTEFTAARERVCSLKNRTMTIGRAKVSKADLQRAVTEGLRETAGDFAKPKLGTFNLPGLKDGVSMLNGRKNKKAWPVVFPGAKALLPMRDAYESIELVTGGGLMRPLYADFLDEAAGLLKRKELGEMASRYRELGRQWTAFAEFLLPAEFAELKAAMRKFAAGDAAQKKRIGEAALGWSDGQVLAHLDEASARLGALHDAEAAAGQELGKVVGII